MQITKPYKGVTVEFDEATHRFSVNGKSTLSTTGVTSIIDKSGALIGWAVKLFREFLYEKINEGREITADIVTEGSKQHTIKKQQAADTGTAIHAWAEEWIKGKNPPIPEDEKIKNGVLAFMKWVDEHKVKFLESEMIAYSKKHDYCGIIDAVAKIGKELVLVDFKSSKGIYQEMLLQACAYATMYEEMTGKKLDKVLIVKFGKEDGNFEIKEIENVKEYKKAFVAALTLKKILKNESK